MRHLSRAHRVDVAWLHEVTTSGDVLAGYEQSDKMAADIYTKGFTDTRKWDHARHLTNVFSPVEMQHWVSIVSAGGLLPAEVRAPCPIMTDPGDESIYTFVRVCVARKRASCVRQQNITRGSVWWR